MDSIPRSPNAATATAEYTEAPQQSTASIAEDRSMLDRVTSPAQQAFGNAKLDALPQYCPDCDVRFACNGGCPKDRFATTPDGDPALHHLCAYQAFFRHVDAPMRFMADRLRAGHDATALRDWYADAQHRRNDPCTCGSGRRFKNCHGAPIGAAGRA